MAPASPAPLSAAQIHKSIAGLAPPFGLGDRLLQKIYAVPPLRLLFFGCVVLPFQVARIAIVEVAIKGILLRGVVGGLLRLLGLKKKRAEKAPDVLTPERLDTAGRRLLGPYYEGSAEKKAEGGLETCHQRVSSTWTDRRLDFLRCAPNRPTTATRYQTMDLCTQSTPDRNPESKCTSLRPADVPTRTPT